MKLQQFGDELGVPLVRVLEEGAPSEGGGVPAGRPAVGRIGGTVDAEKKLKKILPMKGLDFLKYQIILCQNETFHTHIFNV